MPYPGIFRLSSLKQAAWLTRPFLAALALALGADMSTLEAAAAMPETVAAGANLVEVYGDPRFFEGPTWDPASRQTVLHGLWRRAAHADPAARQPGQRVCVSGR